MGSLLTGFVVALGLIIAIGAQNAWVLSKSIRGEHPQVIAAVCITIDTSLIILGVYGLSIVQGYVPMLVPVLTWLGIGLLSWLAIGAFRRAWQGSSGLQANTAGPVASAGGIALQAMMISLLNPHVYLDTVILIGSVGAQQAVPALFVLGAAMASCFWFVSLTSMAGRLSRFLSSPTRWRWFDSVIGCLMLLVAASLLPA